MRFSTLFFFSSRRRHTRSTRDWSSDVCSSDLSGGTNFGPTSQKLNDSIKAAIAAYRTSNAMAADAPVPADAVTSSASGLDPHISVANAQIQAARVAKTRGLALEKVQTLIAADTEGRDWGVFGEPGVNVLRLNVELDKAGTPTGPGK